MSLQAYTPTHVSLFIQYFWPWDINILSTESKFGIAKYSYFSLYPLFQSNPSKDKNSTKEKVSGPDPLNYDYDPLFWYSNSIEMEL